MYTDVVAGAFVELVEAVGDQREELAGVYESKAADKRAELDGLLSRAVELVRNIDESIRAVKVIDHVADQGESFKGIKFRAIYTLFMQASQLMTAADVLALVASYRAPEPLVGARVGHLRRGTDPAYPPQPREGRHQRWHGMSARPTRPRPRQRDRKTGTLDPTGRPLDPR